MKHTKIIAYAVFLAVSIMVSQVIVASAQVSNNYWVLSASSLKPVSSLYSITVPELGGSGTKCLHTNNSGLISTTTGDCGSGSGGWTDLNGLLYPTLTGDDVCLGCTATNTLGLAAKLTIEPNSNESGTVGINLARSGFYIETVSPTNGLLHLQNGVNGGANEVFLGWQFGRVDYNIYSSVGINLFSGPTFTGTTTVGSTPVVNPINFSVAHSPGDGDGRYSNGDQINYKIYSYKVSNGQKQFSTSTTNFTQSAQGVGDGEILTWTPVAGADGYRILSAINNLNYNTYVDCLVASCNGQYLDFLSAAWLSNPTFPNNILTVSGSASISATTTANVFSSLSTTATSTAANGWNLSGGCFAVSGICIGGSGGSGSGTVGSGFTGWTPYYAANGTTLTSTSTIFIRQNTDFTNGVTNFGYVGIASTTPGSMLSIGATNNGINFTPATSTFNTTGGLNLVNGCFASQGTCLGGSVGVGTIGQFAIYAANGSAVAATSSIFLDTMSEVGIGTTSPAWRLNVAGIRPSIAISDTAAGLNNKHWVFSSMGGNLYVGTSTDVFATSTPAALSLMGGKWPGISVSSSTPSAQVSVNTSNDQYQNIVYIASSTATQMRIDNSGNVYFPSALSSGSSQTGYWCYDANGQLIKDTTTCLVSASKFKKDVTPINAGLSEILAMRPVNYFLKTPLGTNDKAQQFGFIAEEAEKVDPRLVTYDESGAIHGFRYEQYTAVLTKAVQELNTKVENSSSNWQWLLMSMLLVAVIYQQVQISRLKK